MCIETMDTKSKSLKTDCLRKTMKPGSKMRWKLLRVASEAEEASKLWRTNTVKATVRKYLRREQKGIQLAKLAKGLCKKEEESRYEATESHADAFTPRHPAGAMAPENTTQYLMANVYDDMCNKDGNHCNPHPVSSEIPTDIYDESLSPSSVYIALDSAYTSCLAFQQRDFEEVFGLSA